MATGIPDIRVLVGNTGDATLAAGGSGALIRENLMSVAKQISNQQDLKVAISLDTSATKKKLQNQLNKLVSGIKLPSLELNVDTTQVLNHAKKKAPAQAAPAKNTAPVGEDTNALTRETEALIEALRVENAVLSQLHSAMSSFTSALSENKNAHANAAAGAQGEADAQKQAAQAKKEHKKATEDDTAAQKKSNKVISEAKMGLAQLNKYLQTVNPKGLTKLAPEIESIREAFKTAIDSGLREDLQNAKLGVTDLKSAFKTFGYEGGNVFTYLGGKIKTFTTYMASSAITMAAVTGVRDLIQTVKDLDASLTDLRIVTGGTRAETQTLLSTYNQMAQELGSTTGKVASSAVEWQRQGYSIADTNTLIKDSMVLSTVGFIDEREAATALTAAMKGYEVSVEDTMSIVDKFTATDMVAATSAGTLATALSKTAANAKLAGVSLDDVIGQLAVVSETMQEGGEQTGEKMRLAA